MTWTGVIWLSTGRAVRCDENGNQLSGSTEGQQVFAVITAGHSESDDKITMNSEMEWCRRGSHGLL
jgi:hypothetical protein